MIGYGLLRAFSLLKILNRVEGIVFSFALGMAFISFTVFFLGLLQLLFLKWVLSILFLALLISLRVAYPSIKNIRFSFHDFEYLYSNKLQVFLVILISLTVLLTFIGAIAPAKGNDALFYHLADTKYFAQHHVVTFIPYSSNSIWPYFMQMLFTLAMLFDNPLLAKLFHFSMAFISGLAVYSLGRRYINKEVAILAAAIFFLTPGVFTQATYAYIDLGWTFYTFIAFYALLLWNFSNGKRWLIIVGIMCGIAADTKYVGLVTPVTVGLTLIIMGFLHKEKHKDLVKTIVIFSIIVGILIFPYYIRPYLHTGNPFYPFYFKYIAESGWYGRSGFDFGMKKTLLNFIVSPWFLTYYPGKIFGGDESQLGPIYLAFLPALLLIREKRNHIFIITFFVGIFYFFWFFIFPAVRYILPIVPFLALLSGYVVWAMDNWDKKLGSFIKIIFIAFLSLNFGLCIYYNREEIVFFARGANVEDYMVVQDRASKICQYINKNTPLTSKILVVNEIRIFYMDREYVKEGAYRMQDKYYLKKVTEIVDDLKLKGITHILYAESQNSRTDDKLISTIDNRFPVLLKDRSFVYKYLSESVVINYDIDPTQKTRYTLYRLK